MMLTSEFMPGQTGQREEASIDTPGALDSELDEMRHRAVADLQSFLDGALSAGNVATQPPRPRPMPGDH